MEEALNSSDKIRVLVVDDSAVVRGMWTRVIDSDPAMRVVASARTGVSALDALNRHAIDVVILDLEMPEMDGITALPLILARFPRIKVIIASALTTQGSEAAVKALALGASDYIAKPSAISLSGGLKSVSDELLLKVKALGRAEWGLATGVRPRTTPGAPPAIRPKALVIGTSTGGPNALLVVLKELPAGFDHPILIVQHMPPFFIIALAERIAKETGRACRVVGGGERVEPGRVYIAPGDFHMTVAGTAEGTILSLNQDPPENFCRPAVDPLFRTAAKAYGSALLAVILTGMGEDGRRGCEAIRSSGGIVVAQDEASSVVWGMPGAVARAGLASAILPLAEIPSFIAKAFQVAGL